MKNQYKQGSDNRPRRPLAIQMRRRLQEGLFLILVACAVFLFISLLTYHSHDPGWSSTGFGQNISNWGGRVGAWLADVFLLLFGIVAYFFPLMIILSGWLGLHEDRDAHQKSNEWVFKSIGWLVLIFGSSGLVSFYFETPQLPANTGGMIGDLLQSGLSLLFNKTGSVLLLSTIVLCGITLVTGLSWLGIIHFIF